MTYQALARKWRPGNFSELYGQEHVVKALASALDSGRLHHAYLLTGTRGVGKTTIARILAKSLNCIKGVTSTPCGVCEACQAIDAGRFVDLLELDAASNTGIDNMRDILDNARYAPTTGRYKVYLIDEVHMLSKAAFNSMLKTLEEPPEHVKFVLATTDPQKIPVTVLSRCLQFNLKALPASLIATRLEQILTAERIPFDAAALARIARAARGSMRDALSVLDQAIAHGAGEVRVASVHALLGSATAEQILRIVDALAAGDGAALLDEARALSGSGVAVGSALDDLASLFHRIAVAQAVPAAAEGFDDADAIARYAAAFAPETVQLAYQICLQGREDLALAPDEETGFTMTVLRMLAFEHASDRSPDDKPAPAKSSTTGPAARAAAAAVRPLAATPPAAAQANPAPGAAAADASSAPSASRASEPESGPIRIDDWPALVAGLKLSGITHQLAAQTALASVAGNELVLTLAEGLKHLADKVYTDKLKAALDAALGRRVRLRFDFTGPPATTAATTLAAQEKRRRDEAQATTEAAFRDDPFVQDLLQRFGGTVRTETIKPVEQPAGTAREGPES
jgi:DNA polymerase-3 subunit gamma/tau